MVVTVRHFSYSIVTFAIGIYAIRNYAQGGQYNGTDNLTGRIFIVTGASAGIGIETTAHLASKGAKVIMACRNMVKAESVKKSILNITNAPDKNLKIMKLDLSSFQSIREFAEKFNKEEKKLNVLINNAGVMWVPHEKTADGFETHFAVNHLGHFLLTNLLLEKLKQSAPSRIVTVSSLAHTRGEIDFQNLNGEKSYSRIGFYSHSKLMNVIFSRELSKRLKGTSVNTYSLHPGAIFTELQREIADPFGVTTQLVRFLGWPFFKSVKSGAQTTLHCALSDAAGKETGLYYSDCAVKRPNDISENDEIGDKLWKLSEKFTGLK